MPDWLKIYHRLPYPLRVLAASARGYVLRRWRYGPETERLVAEALDRETWSPERWKAWREERLATILHRAATRVPYYRTHWQRRRRQGDRSSWEVLEHWPILAKEAVREDPQAFLAEDCNPRHMFNIHTSGTTGKPLSLWIARPALRAWYALFEARWRRWYGLSHRDRWAILGGQLVAPFEQRRPPFWVWNHALNQLYMSSYHLAPAFIPAYVQALHRYRVRYIWGYASSLYALARLAQEQGLELPGVQALISNAEPLWPHQRTAIQEAFDAPVYNTYGMSEMVGAASECLDGSLHLWPDAGVLEILHQDADTPVSPGETGRMIWTGLINPDMPLIRYDIGDRGVQAASTQICPCGRALPRLDAVEGRMDDVVVTPDGRLIGRLDPVFKADMAVREVQLVQDAPDHIWVRLVPAPEYTELDGRQVVQRLRDRVGRQMHIDMEILEHIPRGPNGKFRAVVSRIDRT